MQVLSPSLPLMSFRGGLKQCSWWSREINGGASLLYLTPSLGLCFTPYYGPYFRIYIPYHLAYGERGKGSKIPPFAPLIFELEIHSIETGRGKEKAEVWSDSIYTHIVNTILLTDWTQFSRVKTTWLQAHTLLKQSVDLSRKTGKNEEKEKEKDEADKLGFVKVENVAQKCEWHSKLINYVT